jgi:hypothetical protein
VKSSQAILSLFLIATFLLAFSQPSYSYYLEITVSTEKAAYNVSEIININGTVVWSGSPFPHVLVALQINDRNQPFTYRTVNTGSDPPGPFTIEMVDAYIGDQLGNRVTNVKRGLSYWIWIVCWNSRPTPVRATLTYTICDANNAPIIAGIIAVIDVPAGLSNSSSTWSVYSDFNLGTYTIYGNAYTDLPQSNGVPYSPEKSSQFNIVLMTSTLGGINQLANTLQTSGTYHCTASTLKKTYTRLGNYTVYATAEHWGIVASDSTTFEVILVGDINHDNFVNAKDAIILGRAFGTYIGDPAYNADADLNKDDYCNAKDAIIIGRNFGNSAY